eukprot:scaffold2544_cov141-Isochrysis_galbana.AAC.1
MRKETQPKISIIEQHSTTTDSLVLRQRMYAFSQVLLLLRPAAAAARRGAVACCTSCACRGRRGPGEQRGGWGEDRGACVGVGGRARRRPMSQVGLYWWDRRREAGAAGEGRRGSGALLLLETRVEGAGLWDKNRRGEVQCGGLTCSLSSGVPRVDKPWSTRGAPEVSSSCAKGLRDGGGRGGGQGGRESGV